MHGTSPDGSARRRLNGRLHRINVVSREGEFALDDARPEKIQRLISLGRGEAVKKEHVEIIKARFLNGTVAATFMLLHAVTP